MKKLEPYEKQMMYLVGGSRLPSTPGERELEHKCNPHPNDWIDGIYSLNKLPFADMILEPIDKFDATHFPDGRAKNKAITMW